MDLNTEDLPGEDLVPLLRRPGSDALAEALVGASIYFDDPEDIASILACDRERATISLPRPAGRPVNRPLVVGMYC